MKKYSASARHHFVPVFYIKGFANDSGLLYVYDKKEDNFIKQPKSPKSICFEWNRNIVQDYEGNPVSLLEDEYYARVDSFFASSLARLRNEPITDELISIQHQGHVQYFIIELFWRNPISDFAFSNLLRQAEITFHKEETEGQVVDEELARILKEDPSFPTMQRSGMIFETIRRIKATQTLNYFSRIAEFGDDRLVMGDYPIVFEKIPQTFTGFHDLDYYLPISSRRIWGHSKLEKNLYLHLKLLILIH